MSIQRRMGLMILAALPGLGPVRIRRLDADLDGSVEQLLEMDEPQRRGLCGERVARELGEWRRYFDPARVEPELARLGADFVTCEEAGYPPRLAPYGDRPIGLYRMRAGSSPDGRNLAIVGTRQPSGYGRKVARQFAGELSRSGFTIVSGLADGVDTEAHRAALEAGGRTVAVLGGGLNRCYPSSNRGLMAEIGDSGGVWTEFPLWRSADRRSFPQRNRIVSGISEGVLVIESGERGGSLITARMASEQGKPVYVIPGRIDAPESAGCHALIRDGAQLVSTVEEILEDLSYLPAGLRDAGRGECGPGRRESASRTAPAPVLSGTEAAIWEALGRMGHAHLDALAGALQLPVAEVSRAAMEMEINGHLLRRLDGCLERG
jgi:DNA processing protein